MLSLLFTRKKLNCNTNCYLPIKWSYFYDSVLMIWSCFSLNPIQLERLSEVLAFVLILLLVTTKKTALPLNRATLLLITRYCWIILNVSSLFLLFALFEQLSQTLCDPVQCLHLQLIALFSSLTYPVWITAYTGWCCPSPARFWFPSKKTF